MTLQGIIENKLIGKIFKFDCGTTMNIKKIEFDNSSSNYFKLVGGNEEGNELFYYAKYNEELSFEEPKDCFEIMKKRLSELEESGELDRIKYKYFEKKDRHNLILKKQIEKFHNKYKDNIDSVIEKIKSKYDSKEYISKHYARGREPQTKLYWFLINYAKVHGEPITKIQNYHLLQYGNTFTREMYKLGGYILQIMDGQGSVVHVDKIK